MGLLITTIILSIITIMILGIKLDTNLNSKRLVEWKFRKRMLFGLLWFILLIFNCIGTIKTGEIGVITRFGKIIDTTKNEGVVLLSPVDKLEKVNIKVQKYENEAALSTSTKDLQVVNNISVAVNFKVDGEKAIDLYKKVGINYDTIVLEPMIKETIKAVISQYTAEELVTKRSDVSLNINNTLNAKINEYGLSSVSVSINNFDFSETYDKAIEQKVVAEQQVETAKNQLEKAKIDAEKKIVEAEATNKANALLKQNVTDEVLMKQFIEKWDGKLSVVSGNPNGFININDFIK